MQTFPPMLSTISNICFQSINIFPYLKVFKKKSWYLQLAIAEELYFYTFPFYFPKSYLSYRNKYDMQVKLQIIQSFANTTLTKEFKVLEFLQKFRTSPNAIKADIKGLILNAFQELLQEKLIRKQITLQVIGNKRINKSQLRKTLQIELTQLTPLLIGKTEVLYYLEIL